MARRRDFCTPDELEAEELLSVRSDPGDAQQVTLVEGVADEVVQRWCGRDNYLFRFKVWPRVCADHPVFARYLQVEEATKLDGVELRQVLCYVRDPDSPFDPSAARVRADGHVRCWVKRSVALADKWGRQRARAVASVTWGWRGE